MLIYFWFFLSYGSALRAFKLSVDLKEPSSLHIDCRSKVLVSFAHCSSQMSIKSYLIPSVRML